MKEEYCFVIMPFNPDMDEVYTNCIKPTVVGLGLTCIRQDEVDVTGNIVQGIVESIANAKLIIADLTLQRPNVFYELGIANSLGNNTIVLAQKMEDVPFDIKTYNAIIYSNTIRGGSILKQNLENRIRNFENWGNRANK